MRRLQTLETHGPRAANPAPLGDVLRDVLTALVREAVRAELAEVAPTADDSAALVDRAGLAKALAVSLATVDRLRNEGAPSIRVGEAPRFEVAAVVEWLRARGGGQ